MTGTSALPPTGARGLLGVSGGIAAYKACEVLRGLTEAGHRVRVVPTEAALRFVGEATWAALSGEPVATDRSGRLRTRSRTSRWVVPPTSSSSSRRPRT